MTIDPYGTLPPQGAQPTPASLPPEAQAVTASHMQSVPNHSRRGGRVASNAFLLSLLPLIVALIGLAVSLVGTFASGGAATNGSVVTAIGNYTVLFAGLIAYPAFVLAIVLGSITLKQKQPGRRLAISAIVVSSIGAVLGVIIPFFVFFAFLPLAFPSA